MRFLLLFLTVLFSVRAVAWETDQYTLPDQPLADIGVDVSEYIHDKLLFALQTANQNKQSYPPKIKALSKELATLKKYSRLKPTKELQDDNVLRKIIILEATLAEYKNALVLYNNKQGMTKFIAQAIGLPIALQEKRDGILGLLINLEPYEDDIKNGSPIHFYAGKTGNVYSVAGFHRILHPAHFVFSSTIKMYDVEFGLDKLGHIFNQGGQYYQVYLEAQHKGISHEKSLQRAVDWGIKTEDTYFGSWVSGVYSNADVAANYIGLHFYLNLFKPLTLNKVTYPPILLQDNKGDYVINPVSTNAPKQLLKRFISNHLNEALNPSSLEYLQYGIVKSEVKERCPSWHERYPDPAVLLKKIANLERWNGKDYGFNAENTIPIYKTCFGLVI